ncbi:uncharacterized protein LOC132183403 [Corylus avellana]|uniref:uncharacterized protein LOC132183403 n=1 Tax=Corylus avellana TaxID=13451 RepID=UPI00286C62A0|nr:uncharacterized protein LOC132183403 [Corylus avellana]
MSHTPSTKLSKDYFTSWRTQNLAYLQGQDAYGFMDGTNPPPQQTIPNANTAADVPATMLNLDFMQWVQKDQMILSVLISTLTEPFMVHAVGCATARALWDALISMFASQSRARIMQIHYQLATSKKGNSSIIEYFQKIKNLSDTLVAAGQPLNDFESVPFLLVGLGSDYDPFVTSVTTRVDPLTIDEINGHLLAHEMRIEHNMPIAEMQLPSANYFAHSSIPSGRGFFGRNSYSEGRPVYCGHTLAFPTCGHGSFFPNQVVP